MFSDIFQEPEGYLKSKREDYTREIDIEGTKYFVEVVGEHPLWGNYVWNASKCLAKYFHKNPNLVKEKTVLELGAGAALPSISAIKNGASIAIMTDYPEKELLEKIEKNIEHNLTSEEQKKRTQVVGFMWNPKHTHLLFDSLSSHSDTKSPSISQMINSKTFDVIILSDLICNHSSHADLLNICKKCSHNNTRIYVAFSHHRPWKQKDDLNFFHIAQNSNMGLDFEVKKILEEKYPVMFEKDPGDEEVRSIVHVYELCLPQNKSK